MAPEVRQIVVGDGYLLLNHSRDAPGMEPMTVPRIDPATNAVVDGPRNLGLAGFIVMLGPDLWVAERPREATPVVFRADPRTLRPSGSAIRLAVTGITAGADAVYTVTMLPGARTAVRRLETRWWRR